MTNVFAGLLELEASLKLQGLRASIDLDRVNPPAVWITVDRLEGFTGDGCEVYVALYLVVADQSDQKALRALQGLLTATLEALDALQLPYGIEPITATRILSPYPSGGPDLPAYRILTSVSV